MSIATDHRFRLLNAARLPGRLSVADTAVLLGCADHDIPVVVRAGGLKPLGEPTANAPKYFSSAEVEARARDTGWLNAATLSLQAYWKQKNSGKQVKP
jgi:hypothetical protein